MRARLLLCLALAGCADSGSISFTLELPADPTLDPFALQVSDLTLVATSGGEPLYSATRPFRGPGESLDFGAVPVGDDVSFALIAAAPSGRVLGYGRTDAPVDLAADRGYDIALRVRRPFAYVAGGEALLAVDATSEPGQRYATAIDVGGSPRSAAVTPDGADVVVAVDGAVRLVSTSTHLMRDASVSLPGPVGDLALSPDGAWAVVSHPESPTGVSIVELAALRAGAPAEPVFVVTCAPGQLAVSNDTAWVMLDPLDNIFCMGASSAAAIALADPASGAGEPIAFGRPAGDVAIEPATGTAFVTMPCDDEVIALAGPGAEPETVLAVDGASSVTVARDRVWALGHVDGENAHLILASTPLRGGDVDVLAMPTLEERAVATELELAGQDGVVQMTADLASGFDIAVLPDGEHVSIRVTAGYGTQPAGDAGGGQPIVPELLMVTHEYQLVQLDTGLAAQRLRTSCEITWTPGALLDDFECAQAPGQDLADLVVVPSGVTALYGSR
jgi:hypothetical protein